MSSRLRFLDIFNNKGTMLSALALSVVLLIGIELLIFVACSSASGQKSVIEVRDKSGHVVNRTVGSIVDRDYLESRLGNLGNYDVEISTINKPFPVRAWVSASVGVPMVLILLVAYLIKVYMHLLDGGGENAEGYLAVTGRSRYFSFPAMLNRHLVFYLGASVAMAALSFWMIPNFLEEMLVSTVKAAGSLKWVLLAVAGIVAGLIVWITYLRYRFSIKAMEHRYRLERYHLELERGMNLKESLPTPGVPELGEDRRGDLPPPS